MSIQELSKHEREQLGKPKPGSIFQYITEEEWNVLREILVEKSLGSRPNRTTFILAQSGRVPPSIQGVGHWFKSNR